jgi:hypothetical protein
VEIFSRVSSFFNIIVLAILETGTYFRLGHIYGALTGPI